MDAESSETVHYLALTGICLSVYSPESLYLGIIGIFLNFTSYHLDNSQSARLLTLFRDIGRLIFVPALLNVYRKTEYENVDKHFAYTVLHLIICTIYSYAAYILNSALKAKIEALEQRQRMRIEQIRNEYVSYNTIQDYVLVSFVMADQRSELAGALNFLAVLGCCLSAPVPFHRVFQIISMCVMLVAFLIRNTRNMHLFKMLYYAPYTVYLPIMVGIWMTMLEDEETGFPMNFAQFCVTIYYCYVCSIYKMSLSHAIRMLRQRARYA
ncbi:unnamed protein product [Caenorhabditis sp. 36 PRJEB53466]|nr:unnamed protein product [Caenorhabditis sp. 36 PRJEB53466]